MRTLNSQLHAAVARRGREPQRAQRIDPLDLAGRLAVGARADQLLQVRVHAGQRGAGQPLESLLVVVLAQAAVAVRALERLVERLLGAGQDDHGAVHREDRAAVLVLGGSGRLTRLLRAALVHQVVERVLVVGLEGGDEVVVPLITDERGHIERAHHEWIAEHRLHVLLEVHAAVGIGQLVGDQLLDRLVAERELAENRVERLVLISVQIGVDRHRERGVGGKVGEAGVQWARAVVVTAAPGEDDGEQACGQGEEGKRAPHGAAHDS